MKRFTIPLALGLLGGALLAGCGSEARSEEGAQEAVTITVEQTTTVEETVEDDFEEAPEADDSFDEEDEIEGEDSSQASSEAAIGARLEDDGIVFRVESLQKVESVPRDYEGPIRSQAKTDLWLAAISMKNNGKTGADPMCGGGAAVLIDADGRNFEPLDDSISIKGNSAGYCGDNIQPGFRATVRLAFRTPKGTDVTGIAVWNGDSEDDYFGETYVVFTRG